LEKSGRLPGRFRPTSAPLDDNALFRAERTKYQHDTPSTLGSLALRLAESIAKDGFRVPSEALPVAVKSLLERIPDENRFDAAEGFSCPPAVQAEASEVRRAQSVVLSTVVRHYSLCGAEMP
jgi:hypothetical protein